MRETEKMNFNEKNFNEQNKEDELQENGRQLPRQSTLACHDALKVAEPSRERRLVKKKFNERMKTEDKTQYKRQF